MKRRIEIAQETHQLIVMRRRGRAAEQWCHQCGTNVRMVTPEHAALISGKSLRRLVKETESGALHYHETPKGLLSICLNSLKRHDASETEQNQIITDLTRG